jgi:hypothetical protein
MYFKTHVGVVFSRLENPKAVGFLSLGARTFFTSDSAE